jgi:prevent-host-death family protein
VSAHSVAEAKNRLSRLINRALVGEEIVITRRGHPVVVLRSVAKPARPVTAADSDWLAEHRIGQAVPSEDAGELLKSLRDEDEQ